MDSFADVLHYTESVCPVCLQRIPARHVLQNGDVFLRKTCAKHGDFSTVIWRGRQKPFYHSWQKDRTNSLSQFCMTEAKKGCPYDCGLCPEHRQETCCVLLNVTGRCNLACSFCFAESGGCGQDPSLGTVREWLAMLCEAGKPFIHLSGGEPTLRDDLAEIIKIAKGMGFPYIQLNTNGLRLVQEPGLTKRLKEAGLSSVFLQFDGTNDEIYQKLRGRPLLKEKEMAIQYCSDNRLGVVLVPTLVPGVNVENIGDIIRFGMERSPIVRGVHFQPVSYFGRYPQAPEDNYRVTLPEVVRAIESQTGALFTVDQFQPSGCDHVRCGFHGDFVILPDGKIRPLTPQRQECCSKMDNNGSAMQKNRNFVLRRWELKDDRVVPLQTEQGAGMGEWEALVDRIKTHGFSITGMAFQDCWNLDLERLKECSLHVLSPEGRMIPFCAYYLSSSSGNALYKRGFGE